LADEFISDRELQSPYAKENNEIHESQIYIETLKYMFISDTKDDDNTNNSDLDEESLQFKPHQPCYMTPLCHVIASSAVDDLLIIHTPTNKDKDLKALVDSAATKNFFSRLLCERETTHYSLPFKPSSYSTC
jgi:hypothetical protein